MFLKHLAAGRRRDHGSSPLVLTPFALSVGARTYPLRQIRAVRVVRPSSVLPGSMLAVFVALLWLRVGRSDPVGTAVFVVAAMVCLLTIVFPRRVLMVDTICGGFPVLRRWNAVRLDQLRSELEGILPDTDPESRSNRPF